MKLIVGVTLLLFVVSANCPILVSCFKPTATVVPPKLSKDDLACLTQNLHYEAIGEGPGGMVAVAHVVLNRARDPRFPKTICGVIHQPSQFSWTSWIDRSYAIYKSTMKVATQALIIADPTRGALWYHATYIEPPDWTRNKKVTAVIGKHIFYK